MSEDFGGSFSSTLRTFLFLLLLLLFRLSYFRVPFREVSFFCVVCCVVALRADRLLRLNCAGSKISGSKRGAGRVLRDGGEEG